MSKSNWTPSTLYQKTNAIADLAKQIDGMIMFRKEHGVVNRDKYESDLKHRAKLLTDAIDEFFDLDIKSIIEELGVGVPEEKS